MRPFDWQTDIITDRFHNYTLTDGQGNERDGYSYTTLFNGMEWIEWWEEDEIKVGLWLLTDEELKVCIVHQPLLAGIASHLLLDRVRR